MVLLQLSADPNDAEVSPDTLLPAAPKTQSSLHWPRLVNAELNRLVDDLAASGHRFSKADVVSALVLSCPKEQSELIEMIVAYRSTSVGALTSRGLASVVPIDDKRPGRRPGS